jgi:nitroimidazol reductase NimA-like FMN-containing flavoprotein (pyridoxamine 5'-phosphate oxidase superfamily)
MTGGHLDVLGADECLRLLGEHGVGRLAVVVDGQPLVFPVHYALHERAIVFRTDPGTKLYASEGRRVAFEIDGVDTQYHEGWSVLVVGVAREERDPARRRELDRLPLAPWVAGAKSHWMVIRGGTVTGRRITHAEGGAS